MDVPQSQQKTKKTSFGYSRTAVTRNRLKLMTKSDAPQIEWESTPKLLEAPKKASCSHLPVGSFTTLSSNSKRKLRSFAGLILPMFHRDQPGNILHQLDLFCTAYSNHMAMSCWTGPLGSNSCNTWWKTSTKCFMLPIVKALNSTHLSNPIHMKRF